MPGGCRSMLLSLDLGLGLGLGLGLTLGGRGCPASIALRGLLRGRGFWFTHIRALVNLGRFRRRCVGGRPGLYLGPTTVLGGRVALGRRRLGAGLAVEVLLPHSAIVM